MNAFPDDLQPCKWQCIQCLHFRSDPSEECAYCHAMETQEGIQASLRNIFIPKPPVYVAPSKRPIAVQKAPEKKDRWVLGSYPRGGRNDPPPWRPSEGMFGCYAREKKKTPYVPPPPPPVLAEKPLPQATRYMSFPRAPKSIDWSAESIEWHKNRFTESTDSLVEDSVQWVINEVFNATPCLTPKK